MGRVFKNDRKMRLLIVGNRKHQLIRGLISEIKQYYKLNNKNVIIDVLSQEIEDVKKSDEIFDNVYTLRLPKILGKFRTLRGLFKQLLFRYRVKSLLSNYDIIHVHYMEDIILRDVDCFLKNIQGKLIVSVWGSDFLRATKEKKEKILKLLNQAKFITISNSKIEKSLRSYYKESLLNDNITTNYFIIEPLYVLNEIKKKYTKEESSKLLSLDNNRIIVTIGYNASIMQQHLKILKVLEQQDELKYHRNKIKIVFPVTYPKNEPYIKKLKEKAKKSCYKIEFLERFMTNEEVAHLRNATDIMVQLQTTDMLSASMLEHLYAGNKVITGSWLPYDELRDMGLVFESIDSIENLPLTLLNVINKINIDNNNNEEIINVFFKKDLLVKKWTKLYDIKNEKVN